MLAVLIDAVHEFSADELRRYIIQEHANFGNERWPVIETGMQVLKEKIEGRPKSKHL